MGKYHALYLKSVLEYKYKLTTDLEGKLYIGIALKCEYENFTVQLSMTIYIHAELNSFQHKKAKRPQDSPYLWTQPVLKNQSDAMREITRWIIWWK